MTADDPRAPVRNEHPASIALPPAIQGAVDRRNRRANADPHVLDWRAFGGFRHFSLAVLVGDLGTSPTMISLLTLADAEDPRTATWIDLAPGDGASWLGVADLGSASQVSDSPQSLHALGQGDTVSVAANARIPALFFEITSETGVILGRDRDVTRALVVAAQVGDRLLPVLTAARCGTDANSGRGFSPIGPIRLHKGKGRWLEIGWIEHVTPGSADSPLRPGPPLHVRYVFEGKAYERRR